MRNYLTPFIFIVFISFLNAENFPEIKDFESKIKPFLNSYCIDCHGPKKQKADLRFDHYSKFIKNEMEASELQDVLDILNTAEMPPEDEKQPSMEELSSVLEILYEATSQSREYFSHSKESVVRRMNNRELVNMVEDKFGIRMLDKLLLADGGAEYDTMKSGLSITGYHLDAYLEFGEEVVSRVFDIYYQDNFVKTQEFNKPNWYVEYDTYNFSFDLRPMAPGASYKLRMKSYIKNPDGKSVIYATFHKNQKKSVLITGTEESPQVIEYDFYSNDAVGTGRGGFIFKLDQELTKYHPGNYPVNMGVRTGHGYDNSDKITQPYLYVESAEFIGTLDNQKVRSFLGTKLLNYNYEFNSTRKHISKERSRAMSKLPQPPDTMIKELIQKFYLTMTQETIDRERTEILINIFNKNRQQGANFWKASQKTLALLFAMPSYIYQIKSEDHDSINLAKQLSMFLWSSEPDEQLMSLAQNNELLKGDNLKREFIRMVSHEKSNRMLKNFTKQWLELDKADGIMINPTLFPEFAGSKAYQGALEEELSLFMEDMLQNNRPLRNLIDSDYTFLNSILVKHYNLEGIDLEGTEFKKVKLGKYASLYGGVMTKGILNLLTSNGSRTSPVERGAFILRKFLDDPPPPAPANVPMLDIAPSSDLSAKEILKVHTQVAQCATCHNKIDNIGFGLEAFDPLGRWRESESRVKDKKVYQVQNLTTSGHYQGTSFKDHAGLKAMMLQHEDRVAKSFIKALMSYALGRHVGFGDQKAVDKIISQAKEDGYRMRDLIYYFVRSEVFHQKKGNHHEI